MFSFIFIRGGQIATESMSGQGRPEEGADCSAAVADGSEVCCVLGWMSVFAMCLHCLYGPRLPDSVHRDSQGAPPGPGNDRDYAKCPLCLSVPRGDGFGM